MYFCYYGLEKWKDATFPRMETREKVLIGFIETIHFLHSLPNQTHLSEKFHTGLEKTKLIINN